MKNIGTADIELNSTLAAMERIYSPKYGLANKVVVTDLEHATVSVGANTYTIGNVIPMFHVHVSNTQFNAWLGAGATLSRERSKVKAYGEFIERFCATNYGNDHLAETVFASCDELIKREQCLDFNELIHFEDHLYDNPEFPYARYYTHTPVSWVKGKDLLSGEDIWLPAQKVFLGMNLQHGEQRYDQWLSTGLACGKSCSQAVVGGLFEVVERDSFMLTWLLKLPGTRIVVDSIRTPALAELYDHICRHLAGEDRLYIYDISRTEGVYTVLTFIRNDNPHSFGLIVAAASHVSAETAVFKALEELCLTQAFAYRKLIGDEERAYQALKEHEVTDLHKHLLYYSTGRRSHEIDFISASSRQVQLSSMQDYCSGSDEEIMEYLAELFRKQDQRVCYADITRSEILECGFRVVRAIISGYNDLNLSHQFRRLKNKRLRQFKERYNAQINSAPHPFP